MGRAFAAVPLVVPPASVAVVAPTAIALVGGDVGKYRLVILGILGFRAWLGIGAHIHQCACSAVVL
jgi:hypothetical protein